MNNRFLKVLIIFVVLFTCSYSGWLGFFNSSLEVRKAEAAITYVGGKGAGTAGQGGGSITLTTGLTGGSGGAPLYQDLVVVTVSVGSTGRAPVVYPTGYTPLTVQRTTATNYDTNVQTSYKFMPVTPDTTVTIPGSGSNWDGQAYTIQVFRGVNSVTPEDVTSTYAVGTGVGNQPDPAAITPVNAGAWIYFGGGGASSGITLYTASYLTNFLTYSGDDTNDGTVGSGYYSGWTSGAYDGAAWTGGTTNAANSWGAITLVLRPIVASVAPTVTTPTQASITDTGATLGANVTSDGGSTITSRGTCWATTSNPTTNCSTVSGTTGTFTGPSAGTMSSGTLIYYRGYAINSVGTSYSTDDSFTTLTPADTNTALEVHGGGAQANFNLNPLSDTSGEKFSVLKFQVSDKATADSLPTLIDQITIPISGTGATASTDIAWAELYDDTGGAQVAVATSITNSAITFGSTPNAGGTAALDTIASAGTIRYTVNVYMKNSKLTATDGQTYIFGVNDSNVGADTSTAASSQMRSDTSAVSSVTGTINVAHSQLIFSTQPPTTADTNVDFTGSVVVSATDANSNVDTGFSENITLSAVIDTTHTAPSGVLSSTDSGGLTKTPTNGVATWTDIKYTADEVIDLKAVSTTYSSGIFSTAVTVTVGPEIVFVQQKDYIQDYSAATYTSISVTLDSPATAGNLLVSAIGTDKTAGSYTAPSGFTIINSKIGDSVSGALAYKIAVGGETAISWGMSTANGGSSLWVGEYSGISGIVLDVAAENETTAETTVKTLSSGTTAATTKANELAIAMMAVDTNSNINTGRSWTNGFAEISYPVGCTNCTVGGISVASKNLTSTGAQESTFTTTAATADQMYANIATFKTVSVDSISSTANQIFTVGDASTPIATISIIDSASTPITDANNIRIRIPASFNMTWDTSDTLANIAGTEWAKTGASSSGGTVTVAFEDSNKTIVIPATSDFSVGDYITIYGLSVANFTATSSADNLELVVAGTGGVTAAEDAKTITVIEPGTNVSLVVSAPTSFQPDTAAQYFGTFKMGGVGTVSGLTLTEYGAGPNPELELLNVKLMQDDGDGSWEPGSDTTQLGSTASFNPAGTVTFSNFNLSAGNTSYVHVILDVSPDIIPLPLPTIGIEIAQASHVTSSGNVDSSSWPIEAGISTLSTIYPYLLDAATTGIKVYWLSSSNSVGTVDYGATTSYGSSVNDASSTALGTSYIHKATITGLSAGTTYHYKVTDNGVSSADSTFKTAPTIGSAFDFLVFGDVANVDAQYQNANFFPLPNNVLNVAATINPKTIALMPGDHQHSGADGEWSTMFLLPARNILKDTAMYHTAGNHDYYLSGEVAFANLFDAPTSGGSGSDLYYSFDYGNIHFVTLDGNQSRATSSAQYNWLKADMATAAAQNADWRVLTTHQPGLAYGGAHNSADDAGLMAAVAALGSETGVTKNFDLVLMGHNHVYERSYRAEVSGGSTWVTVSKIGGSTYSPPACEPGDGTCPLLQYAAPVSKFGYLKFSSTANNLIGTYYELDALGSANVTPTIGDVFILPVSATISSAIEQTLEVDNPATAISTITIKESGSSPIITAANDIRIKIPANLYMTWDSTDTSANIAGTNWAKTGATSSGATVTVSYEDSNKTLVVPVTSNFAAGDIITIYGLSFTNFTEVSTNKALELEVDNAGNTINYDNRRIDIIPASALVQDASFIHPYTDPGNTITSTFATAATAGNLLVAAIATDKNSGTYTVPTGFTRIGTAYNGASVSCDFAYKVAVGGETAITWSYVDATKESSMWVGEYEGTITDGVLDVNTEANSGDTAVNSQSTGTTGATSQNDELAVAFFGIDSSEYALGSRSWTNGFAERHYASITSTAGLGVAEKVLSSTGAQESTVTWTPTTDQSCGGIATFKLVPAAATSSLTFSISDSSIGFGTLSTFNARFSTGNSVGSTTESEAHTLSVSTNASGGYILSVIGSTLTHTGNSAYTINPIGATNTASATGTEQFGLRAGITSGTGTVTSPYAASGFAYGATATTTSQIASGSGDDSTTIYSMRYISNIGTVTEAGNYNSTLTYVVTATF